MDWSDPHATLLALLVAAHVFSDFLFQNEALVRAKRESVAALALHGLIVLVVHGACTLPYAWSATAAGAIAGLAIVHVLVDAAKARLDRAWPRRALAWLVLDQAVHAAVLVAVWTRWPLAPGVAADGTLGALALVAAVLVFNANGGSAVVTAVLSDLPLQGGTEGGLQGAGKRIGVLERWIVLVLAWLGQWGAIGLVIAAKSVARFKRMDEQEFAEVYLIGTMTSVLVAMASGALLGSLL